ncbi:MAG: flagellin domain protein, partial [Caulobacteraceae bacterium]|nr:flagellin domain protein [Caulobacteraceae bacterium]
GVLQAGVADLVNADTASDSARLSALQVAQQLGQQSLSIANSTPQILLSLFK